MDNPTKKINAMPKQKCDADTTKKNTKTKCRTDKELNNNRKERCTLDGHGRGDSQKTVLNSKRGSAQE